MPLDFEQKESGLIIPLNNAIISTYQKNSELEKVIMNITNPFNLYTNFNIDTKNEIKHNLYKSYINAKKLLQNNNLKYREIDNLNDIEITNSKEFRDFTSYKINKYDLSKSQLAYIKNNFSFNIKNDNEYYIFQNPNSSIYNKDEHYLMNNNTKKTLEINDFTNYLSSNNTFHSCILDKDSLKNTYKEIANFYKDSIIKDNKIYIKSPKNYNSKFDFVELGEYIESMKKSNIYDNHFNQNNNSLSKTRSIVAMTGPGIYRTNCKILDTPKEFFHIDAPGVPSGIDWRNPANIKNLKTKDSNDLNDKKKERRKSFNL